jgi:hypothetical protein
MVTLRYVSWTHLLLVWKHLYGLKSTRSWNISKQETIRELGPGNGRLGTDFADRAEALDISVLGMPAVPY